MALTIKVDHQGVVGAQRYAQVRLTFDASYDTGGEVLRPADFGLRVVDYFNAMDSGGYSFVYDYVNKVQAWTVAAGVPAEVAGGTDMAAVTARAMAYGV